MINPNPRRILHRHAISTLNKANGNVSNNDIRCIVDVDTFADDVGSLPLAEEAGV